MALIGAVVGGTMSLLGQLSTAVHQKVDRSYSPSLPAPDPAKAAVGLGGFMAISSNTRCVERSVRTGSAQHFERQRNFLVGNILALVTIAAIASTLPQALISSAYSATTQQTSWCVQSVLLSLGK